MLQRVVLDTSVVFKWLIPEPGENAAVGYLQDFIAGKTDIVAPFILTDEIAQALTKRCRRKMITESQARSLFFIYERESPTPTGSPGLASAALGLSLEMHLSYFDCVFLALAIERGCQLVTADARFARAASRYYPYVKLLAA